MYRYSCEFGINYERVVNFMGKRKKAKSGNLGRGNRLLIHRIDPFCIFNIRIMAFWATPSGVRELLPVLCSGVIRGGLRGATYGVGHWNLLLADLKSIEKTF